MSTIRNSLIDPIPIVKQPTQRKENNMIFIRRLLEDGQSLFYNPADKTKIMFEEPMKVVVFNPLLS